jgi:Arm DNA-binding domain
LPRRPKLEAINNKAEPMINRLNALQVASFAKAGQRGLLSDGGGLYLQVARPGAASWIFRYTFDGRRREMGLGSLRTVGLADARAKAHELRIFAQSGQDPKTLRLATGRAIRATKILSFIERGIEPACYLYRHYHPNGDLLYVGISLEPLARQQKHVKGSAWRTQIAWIEIEPFETREEALEAERLAIRTEYPKHNTVHNGPRQPFQEIARISETT